VSKKEYLEIGDTLEFTIQQTVSHVQEAWDWSIKNGTGELRAVNSIIRLISNYNFDTVLDIGCGPQKHARVFRNCGKNVTTIDMVEKHKPTILGNIIDQQNEIPDNHFDCIWASHVLEHQPNSAEFLGVLKRKLKHNGILAITVPPLKHQIVGGHVSLWNMGLLFYNLVAVGFDCNKAIGTTYSYDISIIVRKKDIDWNEDRIRELDLKVSTVNEKTGVLTADGGDFYKLKNYFPNPMVNMEMGWHPHGGDEAFDGNISNIGWKDVGDGQIL